VLSHPFARKKAKGWGTEYEVLWAYFPNTDFAIVANCIFEVPS